MELKQKEKKSFWWLVFAAILFYFALQNISGILSVGGIVIKLLFPFILGGAIAFILNVPMKFVEKKLSKIWNKKEKYQKMKRPCAYLITLLAVLLVLTIALFVVIPELVSTINNLINQVPVLANKIQVWIASLEGRWPQLESAFAQWNIDWDSIMKDAIELLKQGATGVFSSTATIVGGIISAITPFFIAFTFSIYILFQKENLARQFKKLFYAMFHEKIADKIVYVGILSNRVFSNFLSGQCTESMILGMMFFVSMSIFRLPYALLMGVLIAIMSLIPIFGAFIGFLIGFFLIIVVNPMQALAFAILFLVLQQIEGNIIYPFVVGGTVGLPSIWVLAAVTIGGNLFGVAGMLVFIPLCSVCYTLLREVTMKKLEIKKVPNSKWEES